MEQLRWPKSKLTIRVQEVLDHLHDGVELPQPVESFLLSKQIRVGDQFGITGSAVA